MTTTVAGRQIEPPAMVGIVSVDDSAYITSSPSLASPCTHLRHDAHKGAEWCKMSRFGTKSRKGHLRLAIEQLATV